MQNQECLDAERPLFVIGAGPKAAALAAKSYVLRKHGVACPPVWVIDNCDTCAHWTGQYGHTTGFLRLGTPPEKDIGFPYKRDARCPESTVSLFSEFSWLSHQIYHQKLGEWIDRGRPHPTHREWAFYLRRVLSKADNLIMGEISSMEVVDDSWQVTYAENGERKKILCSGVVVTGPGERKRPSFSFPRNVLFGDNFWSSLRILNKLRDLENVVVIGGGETAASIVSHLATTIGNKPIGIVVLTRGGAIFSRGEGYYENKVFTDPTDWPQLPAGVRHEVIKRADRGVFSVDVLQELANSHNITHTFMTVERISVDAHDSSILSINNTLNAQLVVIAMGFDPFWFKQFLASDKQKLFSDQDTIKEIEETLQHDLSVSPKFMSAKLYLPMISAFAQGPGFPNLSCLGLLSDRILGRSTYT